MVCRLPHCMPNSRAAAAACEQQSDHNPNDGLPVGHGMPPRPPFSHRRAAVDKGRGGLYRGLKGRIERLVDVAQAGARYNSAVVALAPQGVHQVTRLLFFRLRPPRLPAPTWT